MLRRRAPNRRHSVRIATPSTVQRRWVPVSVRQGPSGGHSAFTIAGTCGNENALWMETTLLGRKDRKPQ